MYARGRLIYNSRNSKDLIVAVFFPHVHGVDLQQQKFKRLNSRISPRACASNLQQQKFKRLNSLEFDVPLRSCIYNSRNSKDLIVLLREFLPRCWIYNSRNSKDLIVLFAYNMRTIVIYNSTNSKDLIVQSYNLSTILHLQQQKFKRLNSRVHTRTTKTRIYNSRNSKDLIVRRCLCSHRNDLQQQKFKRLNSHPYYAEVENRSTTVEIQKT